MSMRFGSLPDDRRPTEKNQRARIMERLTAAIPVTGLASLMTKGESLSPLEAYYFANFPVLELDSAT